MGLMLFANMVFAKDGPQAIKVACVGDSITAGSGVNDRSRDSYPAQLGRMLGDKYTVKNFGVSRSTLLKKGASPYGNLSHFKSAQNYQADIVIIKLGTNDAHPDNWKYKDEYESNYVEMIRIFQALESKPEVWICYPIPVFSEKWGITDKRIKEEVIPLINKVAKKTAVKFINLHQPLLGKPELAPDKVHPNEAGAKLIAATVAAAITEK